MIRTVRLYTGWILFAYVFTHMTNHMIGLWSLEAMDEARVWFQFPWSTFAGQWFLSISMVIHAGLAFYALYQRRRFAVMHVNEWVQLIFGLSIPPMLILHYLGTIVVDQAYGTDPNYAWMLLIYWKGDIPTGVRQIIVLILAWTHGCLGIYFWLRLKQSWPQWRGLALGIAVLWPILALLGVWAASKEVVTLFEDPMWLREVLINSNQPDMAQLKAMASWETGFMIGYGALLFLTLLGRQLRPLWEARHGSVQVDYDIGNTVKSIPGTSFLDISRQFNQPHASVCGGRGRCSTCRIRVNKGLDILPAPEAEEKRILDRIKAAPDIRLACQCQPPAGCYSISLLMPAETAQKALYQQDVIHQGHEKEITVLFADLRGFTQLSEEKLPYDVVFILNRFFAMMGMAVDQNGGHLDKFLGDGVMALFGIEGNVSEGAKQALKCASDMAEGIEKLNQSLSSDLKHHLEIGIGLHTGPAIIGDMGYGNATQLTAIGDTVNTASRLESLTKTLEADLIASEDVMEAAGIKGIDLPLQETAIRGREQRLCINVLRRRQHYTKLLMALERAAVKE